MQTCTQCGAKKEDADFHVRKASKNGLNARCKLCQLVANKGWARNNKSACRAAVRAWIARNPEKHRKKGNEYKRANKMLVAAKAKQRAKTVPERLSAVDAVRRKLPSAAAKNCFTCGNSADEYHHWSYDKRHWLDVVPLCYSCHRKEHTWLKDAGVAIGEMLADLRHRDLPSKESKRVFAGAAPSLSKEST